MLNKMHLLVKEYFQRRIVCYFFFCPAPALLHLGFSNPLKHEVKVTFFKTSSYVRVKELCLSH